MRKLTTISVALIVAGGVMIAAPATAAPTISNGVACKKSGATISQSGFKYKCGTNPLSTSKKLTWLSIDCLTSANAYLKAAKDAAEITIKLAAQIPVIDLGITNEKADLALTQAKLTETAAKLTETQTKLAAAKLDVEKKPLTAAVASWTAAVRAYTSKINAITLSIKKLESSRSTATSQPALLKADIANTKENAKLICSNGF